MSDAQTPALRDLHPGRYDVPLLIVLTTTLLGAGLCMPLLQVEKMVFWESDYSVFSGVAGLVEQNELVLAAVLLFFSVIFPIAKLACLWWVWHARLTRSGRRKLIGWLEALGRWSMLDVFVVAILIVLVKIEPLASVEPKPGVYVFGGAIILSLLTTWHVSRLIHRIKT